MDTSKTAPVAKTNLHLPQLGFGGASLGDMRETITEAQASDTIETAYQSGIRYFDTSPWYGNGKSELRFGHVLRTKPRNSFILSTKVGRVHQRPDNPDEYTHPAWKGGLPFEPRFDYTGPAILKSYEMSMARLGLNRVDALLIHDLDPGHQKDESGVAAGFQQLDESGMKTLASLKRADEIRAIGAGINVVGMIPRFLKHCDIDFFLVAMPYTLMDQSALKELDECAARGISIVIGAPFASGILARGPSPEATYGYRRALPEALDKARRLTNIAKSFDVDLGAAALQFPLAHPAVVSIIPGPTHSAEVIQNLVWAKSEIPAGFWETLKAEKLIAENAPTPIE